MTIQFLCPNGHKIHCDAKRAGMAAKCPRCGEKFQIPTLEELEAAGAVVGETPAPQPAGSPLQEAAAASEVGLGPAAAADQIEFLCPNNHLVHAPARLQGRPAECPECGSKFRVPSYDDSPPEGEPSEPDATAGIGRGSMEALEDVSQFEEHPVAPGVKAPGELPELPTGDGPGRLDLAAPHPFFALFCRLWGFKSAGGALEVRYGEGQRISPDRFGKALSCGSHAVFGVDEPNGTYNLTAVAWESISVVVVRGAKSLPEGMEE